MFLGTRTLFLLFETIITNFIILHFQIHWFPVARLIFTISGQPVQSIVPCRILFYISAYLLEEKSTHENNSSGIPGGRKKKSTFFSPLFFFLRNKTKPKYSLLSSQKSYLMRNIISNNLNTQKIKIRFIYTLQLEKTWGEVFWNNLFIKNLWDFALLYFFLYIHF